MDEDMRIRRKPLGHLGRPLQTDLPLRVVEIAQHLLLGAALPTKTQLPHHLLKQHIPGASADGFEFLQQLFFTATALVRRELAHHLKIVAITAQSRVAQVGLRNIFIEAIPFQAKKDSQLANRSFQLLDLLQQGRCGGITGLGNEMEKGKGFQPCHEAVNGFKAGHHLADARRIKGGDLPGYLGGQGLCHLPAPEHVVLDLGAGRQGVERLQVPNNGRCFKFAGCGHVLYKRLKKA